MVLRYCVLLITGEDPAFVPSNKAFLDFATANKKEVLRFAYVYQRLQQPLCQALLHNQVSLSPQVSQVLFSPKLFETLTWMNIIWHNRSRIQEGK